jgi:hypothetical protein
VQQFASIFLIESVDDDIHLIVTMKRFILPQNYLWNPNIVSIKCKSLTWQLLKDKECSLNVGTKWSYNKSIDECLLLNDWRQGLPKMLLGPLSVHSNCLVIWWKFDPVPPILVVFCSNLLSFAPTPTQPTHPPVYLLVTRSIVSWTLVVKRDATC